MPKTFLLKIKLVEDDLLTVRCSRFGPSDQSLEFMEFKYKDDGYDHPDLLINISSIKSIEVLKLEGRDNGKSK